MRNPLLMIAAAGLLASCTKPTPSQDPSAKPAPSAAKTETTHNVAAPVQPAAQATPTTTGGPTLTRADANRMAVKAGLPLFWAKDEAPLGSPQPDEILALNATSSDNLYVHAGAFTPAFHKAWAQLIDARRREAVARELDQGRLTVVSTDLRHASASERAVVEHLARAAALVDELYEVQTGALKTRAALPKGDAASHALYARNGSPDCEAPATADDPFCSAAANFQKPRSNAWPTGEPLDAAFCERMGKAPNAKALLNPFTVVRREGGKLVAKPLTDVYGEYMTPIAEVLEKAAAALEDGAVKDSEAPFRAYLLAAAKGFRTNHWWEADEAWSKMNGGNSKFYLRIGPDETYFDPCQVKAGFHVSFAYIDRTALGWQEKLTSRRQAMETALATLIGEPYQAREVNFHMPEFINIIINAGNSRNGLGATIGQSLPNFGPVAAQSRGRTVAMANLYTDPDSMTIRHTRAASLFTPAAMAAWSDDPASSRLDTVLHEATHNFGPNGSWKIDGKLPEEVFGGRTDAILEELKAQTGSYWFLKMLHKEGLIDTKGLHAGWVGSLAWGFGHISRGMFTPAGKPRTYSVLAAIQLRWFMQHGAVRFVDADEATDPGRFDIIWDKMPAAIDSLMAHVGRIKAAGDKAAAKALIDEATNPDAQRQLHATLVTERVTRFPKASFAYQILLR